MGKMTKCLPDRSAAFRANKRPLFHQQKILSALWRSLRRLQSFNGCLQIYYKSFLISVFKVFRYLLANDYTIFNAWKHGLWSIHLDGEHTLLGTGTHSSPQITSKLMSNNYFNPNILNIFLIVISRYQNILPKCITEILIYKPFWTF